MRGHSATPLWFQDECGKWHARPLHHMRRADQGDERGTHTASGAAATSNETEDGPRAWSSEMAKLAKENDSAAEVGPLTAAEDGPPKAAEDGPSTAAEDGPPTAAEDGPPIFQWEKDPLATRTCPHDGCLERLEGAFQLKKHFEREHKDSALWPPATTMLDFGIRRCKSSHCKKMYMLASEQAWDNHQRFCQKREIATDEAQNKVHTCPHDGCLARLTGASA